MVVAEYSEVYSLERADLWAALEGWPRLQAIVHEVTAACEHIGGTQDMPSFKQLEAEAAAGRPLPPHPAHARFTAIMHRVCAEADVAATAGGEHLMPQQQPVTLLQALASQTPQAPAMAVDQPQRARPGIVPPDGAALLVGRAEALRTPMAYAQGGIGTGQHDAAMQAPMRGASVLPGPDIRCSTEVQRHGPPYPLATGSSLRACLANQHGGMSTSVAPHEALHSGWGHSGNDLGSQSRPGVQLPGGATEPVAGSAGATGAQQGQPETQGVPSSHPTQPPVPEQQAAGRSIPVSPRDVQYDAAADPTRMLSGAHPAGSSLHSRPSGGEPEEPLGRQAARDGSALASHVSFQDAGQEASERDSGVRNALLPRSMAHMKTSPLALSRRQLIGKRTEHTSFVQQALHQVLPSLMNATRCGTIRPWERLTFLTRGTCAGSHTQWSRPEGAVVPVQGEQQVCTGG